MEDFLKNKAEKSPKKEAKFANQLYVFLILATCAAAVFFLSMGVIR